MKGLQRKLFHWSSDSLPSAYQILIVFVPMSCAILFGIFAKHPSLGIFASLGGLAVGDIKNEDKLSKYYKSILLNICASSLGFFVGNCINIKNIYSLILIPVLFFACAIIGGISKKMVRLTTIFLVFFSVATSFTTVALNTWIKTLLFVAGELLVLIFAFIFWPMSKLQEMCIKNDPVVAHTTIQLIQHWKKNLKNIYGWQFSLRITSCALIGMICIILLPFPHSSWILLTICIIMQRNIENIPTKMMQRSIGTLVGVLILSLLSVVNPGILTMVILVGILIALRSILREVNYILYSIVMTQLVILFVDFGKQLSLDIMLCRLLATSLGCVISLIFGYIIWIPIIKSRKQEIYKA